MNDSINVPFNAPHFGGRSLEVRCNKGEVCIYGTRDGLAALARMCIALCDGDRGRDPQHVHLEDYELLTPDSLLATVAVFNEIRSSD